MEDKNRSVLSINPRLYRNSCHILKTYKPQQYRNKYKGHGIAVPLHFFFYQLYQVCQPIFFRYSPSAPGGLRCPPGFPPLSTQPRGSSHPRGQRISFFPFTCNNLPAVRSFATFGENDRSKTQHISRSTI